MVFFLNYMYSILYTYCLGQYYSCVKVSAGGLFLLLLPIFATWLVICGGQYQVGADYWNYRYVFDGKYLDFYAEKNEYIFVWIILFFNNLGIHGQDLFYVFYAINFFFLFLVLKRIPKAQYFLFILLYITVTNLFNNQLSTLRQSAAIYIGTYVAFLIFENKKCKAVFFIIIALLIHQSALILLLLFLNNLIVKKMPMNYLFVCMIVAVIMSFVLQTDMLEVFTSYSEVRYTDYIIRGVVEKQDMLQKITKYIFLPFYFLSFLYFRKRTLSERELLLFKWGWISACLRICILNLALVSRLFSYFLILSIFPLLLYLYYLSYKRRFFMFLCIITFLSFFYFMKVVVFARGEYLYDHIYF